MTLSQAQTTLGRKLTQTKSNNAEFVTTRELCNETWQMVLIFPNDKLSAVNLALSYPKYPYVAPSDPAAMRRAFDCVRANLEATYGPGIIRDRTTNGT